MSAENPKMKCEDNEYMKGMRMVEQKLSGPSRKQTDNGEMELETESNIYIYK